MWVTYLSSVDQVLPRLLTWGCATIDERRRTSALTTNLLEFRFPISQIPATSVSGSGSLGSGVVASWSWDHVWHVIHTSVTAGFKRLSVLFVRTGVKLGGKSACLCSGASQYRSVLITVSTALLWRSLLHMNVQ